MKELSNREDVYLLVSSFYAKIKQDDLLGPIFNPIIKDWEHHFQHLTNFWESNLFFKQTYSGDPMEKHVQVDRFHSESISAEHFGVWLNLWYQTIDELFIGETAQLAKNRARNMSTFIHIKIFEARSRSK